MTDELCKVSTIDFIRCKLGLKKRVTDMKKLRKDVEIQSQLDNIPVWIKLLDPPTFFCWAGSFIVGMIVTLVVVEVIRIG